jgi:hypothetical protein
LIALDFNEALLGGLQVNNGKIQEILKEKKKTSEKERSKSKDEKSGAHLTPFFFFLFRRFFSCCSFLFASSCNSNEPSPQKGLPYHAPREAIAGSFGFSKHIPRW